MGGWGVRAAAVLLGVGLVAAGQAAPVGAAASRSWPVGPAALGSLYGSADQGGVASVRTWGSAIWCYVQPTPEADVAARLDGILAPTLDAVAATGGTATVTIGHPAPWVFDNHPRAVRPTALWACGDHASGVSIPSPASLKPAKGGTPSVQAQRWSAYVSRVLDWIEARYAGSLPVVLEVWNEPNLSSGLNPTLRIPGAARNVREAVSALHTYETIAHDLIRAKGLAGSVSLGSSALFTRNNEFATRYLAAHAKKRRIDAIHVNIYGFNGKGPTAMLSDWDRRAARFRARVAAHRSLRSLPLRITEANLNLVNTNGNRTNARSTIARDSTQHRLATSLQMTAHYRGYTSVSWLVPWRREQAAVHIRTEPGNPARDALAVLQSALQGRTFAGCTQRKKVRTCTFVGSDRSRTRVLWRVSGSSKVTLTRATEVLEMTGSTHLARARSRVVVGTTPIVLR